jgi:hypothetical protein
VTAFLLFVWSGIDNTEVELVENSPNEQSPETITEIELDLTKLQGKDRLYTEEEGQYENLSAEERKVVDKAKNPNKCVSYRSIEKNVERVGAGCNDQLTDFSLVSLKNDVAVIYAHIAKFADPGRVYIYDISKDSRIDFRDLGNFAFGLEYIAYLMLDTNKDMPHWYHTLEFYRPGMTDFVKVPDSGIYPDPRDPSSESYFDNISLGSFPVDFDGDTVVLYRHTFKNCVDVGDEYEYISDGDELLDCETASKTPVTFDLSNLP